MSLAGQLFRPWDIFFPAPEELPEPSNSSDFSLFWPQNLQIPMKLHYSTASRAIGCKVPFAEPKTTYRRNHAVAPRRNPRHPWKEPQVACLLSNKKLIDKKCWGRFPHFLAWKSRPSVPEKTTSWKDILQLGKGGMDDPSGGLPPPLILSARERFFWILVKFGCVPEHPPEALVAAIGSGSSLRFRITERELCSSNLSPV